MIHKMAIVSSVAAVVAVFAAPAPSMAGGDDFFGWCTESTVSCQTGVKVAGPVGVCLTAPAHQGSTVVCVDYDGDYVYVKDNKSDGYPAVGEIDGGTSDLQTRMCRNNHTAGTWARCNFNWTEAGTKRVYGGILKSHDDMSYAYLWSFSGN
jgi:hypothetical protein